jgi:hypothetical protein
MDSPWHTKILFCPAVWSSPSLRAITLVNSVIVVVMFPLTSDVMTGDQYGDTGS